jgi:hypothetical protein
MSRHVFIGSAFVAKYPRGGGNYWVPLQYLLGFRDLGVKAIWIEVLEATGQPDVDAEFIESFQREAHRLGIADHVVLEFYPSGADHPDDRIVYGMPPADLDERARDSVLLNLVGSLQPPQRSRFARTVLFDLDPGPFQIWGAQWDMGIGSHDVHLTIGCNLGAPDSPVPLHGIDWKRTWPAVYLPEWPGQSRTGDSYTTLTHWWCEEAAYLGDECFDCNKRNGFIQFVDLPRHTSARLELAANIHPTERDDIELFRAHGWHLVSPEALAATPGAYRAYVQQSRGEFSCAKPAYVKARSGWISDRTVCYLASGRPCVVQDTGAGALLGPTRGLRTFSTVDEAANALDDTEADYARAAVEARRLAEDVFSTRVTLPRVMTLCGI